MKPKEEYPHTKTSIGKHNRVRGKVLDIALPPPDWTSKNGKVKRWREAPELVEISAAYGPIMRHGVVFGEPSKAWAIGTTPIILAACKEYIRRAFEVPLRKEKEFFQTIAKSHGLKP